MITEENFKKMLLEEKYSGLEKTVSIKDSSKFGEAVCAFANDLSDSGKPGCLLIGVRDNGEIEGLEIKEKTEQMLLDFAQDGRIIPSPTMTAKTFHLPEGDVCVAEVQPSTLPPVRFKSRICVRNGRRAGYASEQEEKILIEKRNHYGSTFDVQPCLSATLDELDRKLFMWSYLPLAIDEDTLRENNRDIKLQLASLQFFNMKYDCPTNAGLLMFAKGAKRYFPGASVQFVKFDGIELYDNDIAEKAFEGDLLTQMKELKSFIKINLVKKHLPELGSAYEYNYPASALEELIFNAVIHNDYSVNAPIKFYEFSDRIEITANGGLYGNAANNFPNTNDYRNPVLAGAAKNLGYVNRFGIGVRRAIKALEGNGNPAPEFTTDKPGSFSVEIFSK